MLLGEQEMDVATEIRSIIECVLNDSLRPAIRDLAAAAIIVLLALLLLLNAVAIYFRQRFSKSVKW